MKRDWTHALMRALALALVTASVAVTPLTAQGQQAQSNYCQSILDRIAALQSSLAGLNKLIYQPGYTLAQCNPATGGNAPSETEVLSCLNMPGVEGVWRDAETRVVYVVITHETFSTLAAGQGANQQAINNALALAEQARSKIYYGGVIGNTEAEIASWQAEYARECGGGTTTVPDNNGCLLGVCPDLPVMPTMPPFLDSAQ